jgi:hypothetical protein
MLQPYSQILDRVDVTESEKQLANNLTKLMAVLKSFHSRQMVILQKKLAINLLNFLKIGRFNNQGPVLYILLLK